MKNRNRDRKVLFVIIEGMSDELFFFDALERYTNEQIIIKSYGGDIFTDPAQETTPIRERIRNFFIDRLGDLQLKDIVGIIHISDTDGSYIPDEKVIIDENQQAPCNYSQDGIFVKEWMEKEKIEKRNQTKRQNTVAAASLDHVQYKRAKIPYRLFYLSQNLEHAIFGRLNVPSGRKVKNMAAYLKKVRGTAAIGELLKSLLPPIDEMCIDKHQNSWDFIMDSDHSLQRFSNTSLMYEFISEISGSQDGKDTILT